MVIIVKYKTLEQEVAHSHDSKCITPGISFWQEQEVQSAIGIINKLTAFKRTPTNSNCPLLFLLMLPVEYCVPKQWEKQINESNVQKIILNCLHIPVANSDSNGGNDDVQSKSSNNHRKLPAVRPLLPFPQDYLHFDF